MRPQHGTRHDKAGERGITTAAAERATAHPRAGERGAGDAASAERAIAMLARKRCGTVSNRQLQAMGFAEGAIKRRLRAGRLHRLPRGVYLVGHSVPAEGALEWAAVLASGDGCAISHRSAARLLNLPSLASWRAPVEVTVPGRDPGRKPGILAHRVRTIDARDIRRIRGLPVTTPTRTLVDLAAVLSIEALECAVADARRRRLINDRTIADQIRRSRARRGAEVLRRVLGYAGGPAVTRSEAERKLATLLRAARLPVPEVNARVHRFEVDFHWRKHRLVAEVDGYGVHSTTNAFERDRERDGILAARGYSVIRITWRQLVSTPEAVIAKIAAALAVRGAFGP